MASDPASSENDAEMIRECEQYVEQNNIQIILKDAIFQLCVARPDNPFKFLREHFEKLEKVRIVAMFCSGLSLLHLFANSLRFILIISSMLLLFEKSSLYQFSCFSS